MIVPIVTEAESAVSVTAPESAVAAVAVPRVPEAFPDFLLLAEPRETLINERVLMAGTWC